MPDMSSIVKTLSEETRQAYLDRCAGLMILFMVVFHVAGQYGRTDLYKSIGFESLFFFMFWFFFKGGIVDKHNEIDKVLRRGFVRLIVPAIIWTIIGMIIYEGVGIYLGRDISGEYFSRQCHAFINEGSLDYHLPVWFLLSLYVVRLSYSILYRISGDRRLHAFIAAISLEAAFILNQSELSYPYYLANIPLGLALYIMGTILGRRQYEKRVVIPFAIIYSLILLFIPSTIDFRTNRIIEGNYLAAILYSVSGCFLFNYLFQTIPARSAILEHIGRNSLAWLLLHWPVKYITGIIFGNLPPVDFMIKVVIVLLFTGCSVSAVKYISRTLNIGFIIGEHFPDLSPNHGSKYYKESDICILR